MRLLGLMLPADGAIAVAVVPQVTRLAVFPPRIKTKWSTRATAMLLITTDAKMPTLKISANRFIVLVPVVEAAAAASAAFAALHAGCIVGKVLAMDSGARRQVVPLLHVMPFQFL